jgi:hypothetical protein
MQWHWVTAAHSHWTPPFALLSLLLATLSRSCWCAIVDSTTAKFFLIRSCSSPQIRWFTCILQVMIAARDQPSVAQHTVCA